MSTSAAGACTQLGDERVELVGAGTMRSSSGESRQRRAAQRHADQLELGMQARGARGQREQRGALAAARRPGDQRVLAGVEREAGRDQILVADAERERQRPVAARCGTGRSTSSIATCGGQHADRVGGRGRRGPRSRCAATAPLSGPGWASWMHLAAGSVDRAAGGEARNLVAAQSELPVVGQIGELQDEALLGQRTASALGTAPTRSAPIAVCTPSSGPSAQTRASASRRPSPPAASCSAAKPA